MADLSEIVKNTYRNGFQKELVKAVRDLLEEAGTKNAIAGSKELEEMLSLLDDYDIESGTLLQEGLDTLEKVILEDVTAAFYQFTVEDPGSMEESLQVKFDYDNTKQLRGNLSTSIIDKLNIELNGVVQLAASLESAYTDLIGTSNQLDTQMSALKRMSRQINNSLTQFPWQDKISGLPGDEKTALEDLFNQLDIRSRVSLLNKKNEDAFLQFMDISPQSFLQKLKHSKTSWAQFENKVKGELREQKQIKSEFDVQLLKKIHDVNSRAQSVFQKLNSYNARVKSIKKFIGHKIHEELPSEEIALSNDSRIATLNSELEVIKSEVRQFMDEIKLKELEIAFLAHAKDPLCRISSSAEKIIVAANSFATSFNQVPQYEVPTNNFNALINPSDSLIKDLKDCKEAIENAVSNADVQAVEGLVEFLNSLLSQIASLLLAFAKEINLLLKLIDQYSICSVTSKSIKNILAAIEPNVNPPDPADPTTDSLKLFKLKAKALDDVKTKCDEWNDKERQLKSEKEDKQIELLDAESRRDLKKQKLDKAIQIIAN